MDTPNVKTTMRSREQNFVFHVMAYRVLTESEMIYALKKWMKINHFKKIPKNKEVTFITILGFDE